MMLLLRVCGLVLLALSAVLLLFYAPWQVVLVCLLCAGFGTACLTLDK